MGQCTSTLIQCCTSSVLSTFHISVPNVLSNHFFVKQQSHYITALKMYAPPLLSPFTCANCVQADIHIRHVIPTLQQPVPARTPLEQPPSPVTPPLFHRVQHSMHQWTTQTVYGRPLREFSYIENMPHIRSQRHTFYSGQVERVQTWKASITCYL